MATELGRTEADAHGVRRVLCDQIDEATDLLRGRRISDRDIHSARKSLKRARATLRLLRAAVPSKVFDRENATLRDVARPLGSARDAKVLLDSLDRLAKLYGPTASQSIPPAFRHVLAREQDTSRRSAKRQYSERTAPVRKLLASQKHILTSHVRAHGWEEIGEGLERVYRSGRKAMKDARRTATPECLHEWRKQAKYLSYQLQLLEPMCPGRIGALADQVHKLSDYLGDDHDFAVLREKVAENAEAFPAPGGPGALLALIDRCQDRLRARAFFAGRRIYDDKPAAFTKKLARYWQRGRPARAQRSH
jgi:CHAD domain-containing protein